VRRDAIGRAADCGVGEILMLLRKKSLV